MNEIIWDYQKEIDHVWKTYHRETSTIAVTSLSACIDHGHCPGYTILDGIKVQCNCICHLNYRSLESLEID
jgi:hypothetical protein